MPSDSSPSRERLLAAAQGLFHRYGYTGTSLDHIVAEAGLTKGSFYHHFESKEALALEVLDWYRHHGAQELDFAGLDALPSAREALLTLLDRLLQRGHRALGEVRVCGCFFGNFALELAATTVSVRARVGAVFDGIVARMTALITRAQDAGEVDASRDARALASALLALAEGAILLDKAEQGARHSQAARDAAAGLLRP